VQNSATVFSTSVLPFRSRGANIEAGSTATARTSRRGNKLNVVKLNVVKEGGLYAAR
jgi:hypothetical protein